MKNQKNRKPFAHPSELFIAEIFDSMGFDWEYEEHDFLLSGKGADSEKVHFCPDFFLPDFGEKGLFLEVTTGKSGSRRGKNRKIRTFRNEHPEVPIVLIDRETIMGMCVRFGRIFEELLKREQLPAYKQKSQLKVAA